MKKNEKIILYLITILLIILVFMGGYIIYNMTSNNNTNQNNDMNQVENNQNNNSTDKNETNNDLNSNEKEEISNVSHEDIEKLKNRWLFYFSTYNYTGSTNYDSSFGFLYRKNKTLISELSKELRMLYVIHNIDLSKYDKYSDYEYRFSIGEFKKLYYELLDEKAKFEQVNTGLVYGISFDDNYAYLNTVGGDTVGPGYHIKNKFIKSEQKNDEIYLYEKVLIQYSPEEGDIKYYSNFDLQNSFAINEKLEDVFEKYSIRIPTYKHTFKIKNGNYIYYSVEKVNE